MKVYYDQYSEAIKLPKYIPVFLTHSRQKFNFMKVLHEMLAIMKENIERCCGLINTSDGFIMAIMVSLVYRK